MKHTRDAEKAIIIPLVYCRKRLSGQVSAIIFGKWFIAVGNVTYAKYSKNRFWYAQLIKSHEFTERKYEKIQLV